MTSKKIKTKKLGKIKLMPIGKDGKEVDWFHGWKGIEKLTKSLGKSWVDVGELIEDTWADRTSAEQIWLCQEVHKSLQKVDYYRRPRLKTAPSSDGRESDMHYAIRMNLDKIKKHYEASGGKAKDIYKAVTQLYNSMMNSNRKNYVLAYLPKPPSEAKRRKVAKARGKALGTHIIGKILKGHKFKK